MPCIYISIKQNKTQRHCITTQQKEEYRDDDGGYVELDCDADVLVVMIVIGDYDGDIFDDVSGDSL